MEATTFDRHYEGTVLLDEVQAGENTKGFDFHYEGRAIVAEEEVSGLSIPIAMHHYKQLMGAC